MAEFSLRCMRCLYFFESSSQFRNLAMCLHLHANKLARLAARHERRWWEVLGHGRQDSEIALMVEVRGRVRTKEKIK